jgi:NTP pyrophosphatase (non-canonical NTP hydrolase)
MPFSHTSEERMNSETLAKLKALALSFESDDEMAGSGRYADGWEDAFKIAARKLRAILAEAPGEQAGLREALEAITRECPAVPGLGLGPVIKHGAMAHEKGQPCAICSVLSAPAPSMQEMPGLREALKVLLERKFPTPLDRDKGWKQGVQVGVAMVKASLRKLVREESIQEWVDKPINTPAQSSAEGGLRRLQAEQVPWVKHNFGDRPSWMPLLGAVEELGELAHAHLKQAQGIRVSENHDEKAKDAVADVVIYLADYCSARGFDLETLVMETWDKVKLRDWKKDPAHADIAAQPTAQTREGPLCVRCGQVEKHPYHDLGGHDFEAEIFQGDKS